MIISDKYLIKTDRDISILHKCLAEGKLSGTSEVVEQYEKELAKYWAVPEALAVSSGTAALVTALYTLGITKGDEVIVSVLAPIMSVLPVLQVGAVPVFADCQGSSFDFDITSLKGSITEKTKAVIAVPIYGYPFEYEPLRKVCDENNLFLIEDAAQAHGSEVHGKLLGTFGDIGCFSTHDRKILSTGEGGFLLFHNKKLFEKAKAFIQFDHMSGQRFGTNYKISTLQAALGIARIPQIEWQIKRRNRNANHILNKIKKTGLVEEIQAPEGSVLNYYSLVIEFAHGVNVKRTIKSLDEAGIPSDVLKYKFVPLYERELLKKYYRYCPNAEALCRKITTIPVHPGVTQEELDYMVDKILFSIVK